jgi:hypothetical protein
MDCDASDKITCRMPIISHESVPGIDCCGRIIAAVEGSNIELRCNECGSAVGVLQIDVPRELLALAA